VIRWMHHHHLTHFRHCELEAFEFDLYFAFYDDMTHDTQHREQLRGHSVPKPSYCIARRLEGGMGWSSADLERYSESVSLHRADSRHSVVSGGFDWISIIFGYPLLIQMVATTLSFCE
jgi:hypothetical protein